MPELLAAARRALTKVLDPETGISVIDMGLIYDIHEEEDGLRVWMTFTSEHCPLGATLERQVAAAIASLPDAPWVQVSITFDPPWTPERITPEGRSLLGR